jgi:signal peptidase I
MAVTESGPQPYVYTFSWRDIAWTVVAAVSTALLLKIFVVGAFRIPSHSMENTLMPGDYIVVSKLAYTISRPERGDIVVFRIPQAAAAASPSDVLIKRVVAIGGDTVRLGREGVFVNGRRQPAPPTSSNTDPSTIPMASDVVVVPDGHLFVIGDNRTNSYDSRSWGFLPLELVEGRPLFMYWSYGPDLHEPTPHIRINRLFGSIR